jgi:chromosome segregation ATPase
MLLHNQTRLRLNWDASGRRFTFEPFGSCEVPEELVPHIRAQKVPVGEVPVTPERKAHAAAEEGAAEIRNDELRVLRERVVLAEADSKAARAEVSAAEERRDTAEAQVGALRARITALESELAAAKADANAAEELVHEQSKKLEVARNPKKGEKSAGG